MRPASAVFIEVCTAWSMLEFCYHLYTFVYICVLNCLWESCCVHRIAEPCGRHSVREAQVAVARGQTDGGPQAGGVCSFVTNGETQ